MARWVYVSAPPASSVTVTAGQRAQVKVTGERTREVTLDPGATAGTPVRNQGPGRSLSGPDADHPLHGAGSPGDPGTAVPCPDTTGRHRPAAAGGPGPTASALALCGTLER
jgi:hypothetical protein